ncbi:Centromere-binding protein ParB C-terminal domain-containing protein [Mycobacterium sp. smrl_JER01]|uniref:ribbon-helix-helix domain-containing protein n=2 Tax=Mycobacterium sp. smrl_JER01 TaxID=3402633 RepID=UPI003D743AC6
MGNGMDMLKAQRDKRKPVGNEMPKPLHGPRATPVSIPAATEGAGESEPSSAPAATDTRTSSAAPAAEPAVTPSTKAKRPAVGKKSDKAEASQPAGSSSELYPTTAYLELEEDKYIRRALEAGRYGKPKVTSASAVIRYAVRHLAEHMTPEQVVAAIREAAPETSNQGRIRL